VRVRAHTLYQQQYNSIYRLKQMVNIKHKITRDMVKVKTM